VADDAVSNAAELRGQIRAATGRLLETASRLTDEQVRAPSLLPGWTRGHVLTHLARNADGLRNLLIWARTGVETPQYASEQARNEAIEAGAPRPAAEQAADTRASAAAFDAEAGTLSPEDWHAMVSGIRGRPHPAIRALWRRLSEVEIHHVDLDAGYGPGDWPADFVSRRLAGVADDFRDHPDCPAALLTDISTGRKYSIGTVTASGAEDPASVTIAGPGNLLLAWLIGRSQGDGLTVEPSGQLPAVPAW
jgi:maleylpyruvate isomerase